METTEKMMVRTDGEKKRSLVLYAFIVALCGATHWFPLDVVFVSVYTPAIVGAALALSGSRIALPHFWPRGQKIAGALYYFSVAFYGCFLLFFNWLQDHVFVLIFLPIFLVAAAALFLRQDKKWPALILAASLWLYLLGLPHTAVKIMGSLVFVPVIFSLVRFTPRQIGPAALLFAGAIAFAALHLGYFYYGERPDLISQITAQPGVEAILPVDAKDRRAFWKMGRQIRFAAQNKAGTHYLIGTEAGVVVIKKGGGAPEKILRGTSSDQVAYMGNSDLLAIGNYSKEAVALFVDKTLAPAGEFPLPGHAFTNLRYEPEIGMLLTGDDFTRDICLFSEKERSFDKTVPGNAGRDALLDPTSRLFIATTLRRVLWIHPDSGETVYRLKLPSIQLRLEIDPEKGLLYVSCFSTGELLAVDLATRKIVKTLKLEPGIRFLKLTEDKKSLFVSSYFKGQIFEIDTVSFAVKKTLLAGPRVRSLHISPGSKYLIFGSAAGAFRVRIRQ